MDVIALHQAGFTNAVASLGTALTPGHASLIRRYVQEVYLTYDSDDAGTRAALRAVPILREAGISAKVIRMDPYKDPDEFIKNLGAEEYEKRIREARNGFMFTLEVLARGYDMNSPEGKTAFFREAARRLMEFEDELERENYIDAVASAYKVSRESLEKLVAKTAVSSGMAKPVERPKKAEGREKGKEDGILINQHESPFYPGDAAACQRVIKEVGPDAVMHCAAYTAVDAAEENVELCRKINGEGTRNIAEVCRELDIPMMYISTDYVFDGQGERPWEPDDERHPLNVYGQTKYEGELAVLETPKHFIVRISWVFGRGGKNFVKTMLRLSETHSKLTVVDDQIGAPTYTRDLSRLLADMAESEKYGIYHASNSGEYISWYQFAKAIFEEAGKNVEVLPVSSEEYGAKARRPFNSRMDCSALEKNGFEPMPHWRDALKRYLKETEVI